MLAHDTLQFGHPSVVRITVSFLLTDRAKPPGFLSLFRLSSLPYRFPQQLRLKLHVNEPGHAESLKGESEGRVMNVASHTPCQLPHQ